MQKSKSSSANLTSNTKTLSTSSQHPNSSSTNLFYQLLSKLSLLSDLNPLFVFLLLITSVGVFGSVIKYLSESSHQISSSTLSSQPNALPSATVQLSKEYIYAGSRFLAVEDANASAIPPADLAVWRPSSGFWFILSSDSSQQTYQPWGGSDDLPVPADYDGDGRTDFCVFRPSSSTWWVMRSSDASYYSVNFGQSGDVPIGADFDGDGWSDMGVYRSGRWHVRLSSEGSVMSREFGLVGDEVAVADYDGDGRADIGVWRSSERRFYSVNSRDGQVRVVEFGVDGDVVSGDYDGDGRADYAIRSGSRWVIRRSADGVVEEVNWGEGTDVAVQNDYDADGKVDVAVWRGVTGMWYIRNSSNGQTRQVQWGTSGDIPVPAFYRR